MIVTSVERQRGRQRGQRRVNVFIDGEFALALGSQLAAERDVRGGRSITRAELVALQDEDARRSALDSALRLLSYRPRSARELGERLRRKGYQRPVVERTLARLRELGYLDDAAFARFWTETRQSLRPRSKRLLAADLRRRGIASETAEEATAELSDDEAAYEAAGRRMSALSGLEYRTFRERLGRFLTSRGFSYGVARKTIETRWAELGQQPESDAG
ncbi:MAG: regulatory protein RecX [Dehalococcoidia bacterium]